MTLLRAQYCFTKITSSAKKSLHHLYNPLSPAHAQGRTCLWALAVQTSVLLETSKQGKFRQEQVTVQSVGTNNFGDFQDRNCGRKVVCPAGRLEATTVRALCLARRSNVGG